MTLSTPKHSIAQRQSKRESYELRVESIGFEGKAIARRDGLVYFVDGAVPGDVVVAEVHARRRNHVEARVIRLLQPSEARIAARCKHFGTCGGCSWQHLHYDEQLCWKQQHVRDAFERLGKLSCGQLHPTLAAPDTWNYRNKMEFSFGDSRWLSAEEIASKQQIDRSFALGLHIPGRFDKVLDVEECFLPPPTAIIILNAVREAAKARSCSVFQTRTHEGFLRNLVLRTSRATKELMVILVTSPPRTEEEHDMIRWFSDEFTRLVPAVTTTVHAVSHSKASLALGEPHVLHGSGRITEELLGIRFEVSPFSFFQTNSAQAEQLFSTALQFAGLSKSVIAWDLYCGAGSITLPAARQAKHVVGIELSESSIADARRNALLNGITNVAFYAEDMYKAATTQLLLTLPQPDVVIVDPPRAGMHAEVVQMLRRVAPPVIVYVSCNPATQARDCALLAAKSPAELSASEHSSARYIVEQVQPVDMFPHTYHIESVARLVRVQE